MGNQAQTKKLNLFIWLCRIAFFSNYFWFGLLKFFPGLSPAENLAVQTLNALSAHTIPGEVTIYLLASLEVLIGLGFLIPRLLKWAILLMLGHMILTFSTFLFFPDMMFTEPPFGLTLVSQYVLKNLVFISTGLLMLNLSRQSGDT